MTRSKFEGMYLPLVLTLLLLAGSAGYLGWKTWNPKDPADWIAGDFVAMMKAISLADVGQFVSGLAGALVFIWIIFTYSAQREELALQRAEMAAQRKEFEKLAGEAHNQGQLLEQTSVVTKRDAFIRYLELRERAMALVAADLLRMTATTPFHHSMVSKAWENYERGDTYAFFRTLTAQVVRGEHQNFMARVRNVMTALEWVAFLHFETKRILEDAKQIDDQMHRLCFNAPWRALGDVFGKLLEEERGDGASG